MKIIHHVLIIIFSTILAAVSGIVSVFIQNSLIDFSTRNMFGLAPLKYLVVAIFHGIFAFILAIILTPINSFGLTALFSLVISLIASIGNLKTAYEIYHRPDYFDKISFQADIFQICSNFIIFPLIGYLIWSVKKNFAKNYLS